ncbi:MAG: hypothetical protein J6S67_19995 [Methanobrevibacter sp.]|nr:hypothetical protein [Methanobrevibacter sp.]
MGFISNTQLKSVVKKQVDSLKDGSLVPAKSLLTDNFDTKMVLNDQSAYNFRPTALMGTMSLEVGSPCKEKAIIGGSLGWNQLVDKNTTSVSKTENNVTFVDNRDGTYSVSTTAEGASALTVLKIAYGNGATVIDNSLKTNHKFFISGCPAGGSLSTYRIQSQYAGWIDSGSGTIRQGAGTNDTLGELRIAISSGTIITTPVVFRPNFIDLTACLGPTIADYIYSLEQATTGAGVAWFRRYFHKPYYAYKAIGDFTSVVTSGKKITRFNQFDISTMLKNVTKSGDYYVGYYSDTPRVALDISDLLTLGMRLDITIKAKQSGAGGGTPILRVFYTDGTSDDLAFARSTSDAVSHLVTSGTKTISSTYVTYGSNPNSTQIMIKELCISFYYDGERAGEIEDYSSTTVPVDPITLIGIPKLDANNNLYFDGNRYNSDGTVEEICDTRAYQSGDESDSTVFTNGVNTIYKKTTPTTGTPATPFTEVQDVDNWGTEEFLPPENDTRPVVVPVGHDTNYLPDYKAKSEVAADMPGEDGDYILHREDGECSFTSLSAWLSEQGYNKMQDLLSVFGMKDALGGALRQTLANVKSLAFDNTVYVDMGDLNWDKQANASSYRFVAELTDSATPPTADVVADILCSNYASVTSNATWGSTRGVSLGGSSSNKYAQVYDSTKASMTSAEFKASVKGILLAYKKA